MNFELTKEQKQIQKAARNFVKGEFKKEVIQELVGAHAFPEKAWALASELGFFGIHFPEDFDGEGLGHTEKILIAEELARGHSSLGACVALASHGADILIKYGTRDQKKNWLPGMANGEILPCLATEEAKENSAETTAVKEGEEWVINGAKAFVVNAGPMAGLYLVLCRTDPDIQDHPKTYSFILVPSDCQGMKVVHPGNRLGLTLLPLAHVEFSNVRVPLENLLDRENKGMDQLAAGRDAGCLTLAALALGTAQGAFDRALAHTRERKQFGKKLIDFQITRHKLAMMATQIETARLMARQAAQALEKGKDTSRACAMAKLVTVGAAVSICDEALQLFGGYGYICEYEIEAFYRDAKTLELLGGSPHAQKDVISQPLAGKKQGIEK